MATPGRLTIEAQRRTDRVILKLGGELDLSNSDQLERAIADTEKDRMLVLDLQLLEFIDSTGLRALLAAADEAAERGQLFAITPSSAQVERLLSVTGVSERLPSIATPDEVLA